MYCNIMAAEIIPGAVKLLSHACAQERFALLAALLARGLSTPEEIGELTVAVTLRVLDVALQAQGVAQRLLREPDQVVVLVLGAGYLAGLLGAAHRCLLSQPACANCCCASCCVACLTSSNVCCSCSRFCCRSWTMSSLPIAWASVIRPS